MKIAIIGAGLSSAVLCQSIRHLGSLEIFEKSRGVGGRMATRQIGADAWDHGAPCFIARDTGFKRFLQAFLDDKALVEWHPKMTTLSLDKKPYKRTWFESHYISEPTINHWIKPLFAEHPVETQVDIQSVYGEPGAWYLATLSQQFGPFDWVISTTPLTQTKSLFSGFNFPLTAHYQPGFTLLCRMASRPSWDRAVCQDEVVAELIVSASRPGQSNSNTLVAHAQAPWAAEHLEAEPSLIAMTFTRAIEALLNAELESTKLHRWRSAQVVEPAMNPHWLDPKLKLGACGDWGGTKGIESAFVSAKMLSGAIVKDLQQTD